MNIYFNGTLVDVKQKNAQKKVIYKEEKTTQPHHQNNRIRAEILL